MSEPSQNAPAPAGHPDAAPWWRIRKPIDWPVVAIAVLAAVGGVIDFRRHGAKRLIEDLNLDLSLFPNVPPRVLAGCLLGAFIAKILTYDKLARWLGPQSGLKGVLIGAAFGVILPLGPSGAYPMASALLAAGADVGATIAMIVSWALIGYRQVATWEIPIMGTEISFLRILVSLPLPLLAGCLGRFVHVRIHSKQVTEKSET